MLGLDLNGGHASLSKHPISKHIVRAIILITLDRSAWRLAINVPEP